jgi:hypothetical protein
MLVAGARPSAVAGQFRLAPEHLSYHRRHRPPSEAEGGEG